MPDNSDQLIGECATWLSITSHLFTTRMGHLLEPYGLTAGQFSILNHMAANAQSGGARISDIARAVEVGQPAVTKAVAKFQNMELATLVADKIDQRSKRARLTEQAHDLLATIRQDIGRDLGQVFGALEPMALPQFTAELRDLARWLDDNRL